MEKRWELLPVDEKIQQAMAKSLHISTAIAGILAKRKFTNEEANLFLHPEKIEYLDPFLLKDMDKACARLVHALNNHEKICIYGDYDVDGVSSSSLLMFVLGELGFEVNYYLPDRHSEGYGLHVESLDKLIPKYDLIVTVDCGITAIEEAEYAKGKIDMIITDHHLPREQTPFAVAVVNPNQTDCPYPNKNLCGVGVAFKLCQALYKTLGKDEAYLEKYLDIVALGTIADIVPLIGENRHFVQTGLAQINNLGIETLLSVCDYDKSKLNTGHIGFGVAPRLNAAGRLTHASMAVELLLAKDKQTAREKAEYLDKENRERQEIVEDIFNQAVDTVEAQNLGEQKVIVVVGKNWHEGVIGIAASRLQERYYRPIIIIAVHDGIGKASCRSIEGFHMKNALTACEKDFIVYGGHSMAAGFSIEEAKIPEFIEHIKAYADANLPDECLTPIYPVEAVVNPEEITIDFIEDLTKLEPYGMGNPKPKFVCQNVYVSQCKAIGKEGNHLRFIFERNQRRYMAIGWHMAEFAPEILHKNVDILFEPDINIWNDKTYIQFKLVDVRLSKNKPAYLEAYPRYDLIGKVYLSLRQIYKYNKSNVIATKTILQAMNELYHLNLSEYCLKQCLVILSEINILTIKDEQTILLANQPAGKIDIKTSPTFAKRFTAQIL